MATEPTVPRVRKPRVPTRRHGIADWFHRQTKQAKAAVSVLAALGAIVSGVLFFDSTYARAGDVSRLSSSIELNQLNTEIAIKDNRRGQVMDKIHDLQARSNRLQPHERQALQRYQLEHTELTKDIDQKKRLADRVRFGK